MASLGKVYPVLTTAPRAERATLRASREMARARAEHDPESAELDDSHALLPAGLARLIACHQTSYQTFDWRDMTTPDPVAVPTRTHERERTARRALATWRPGWYDRLFANEASRRRLLNEKVMEAARDDEAAFQKDFQAATAHNAEVLATRQLLDLDPRAIKDAISAKTRLSDVSEPMNRIGVALPGGRRVIAVVEAINEADIPYLTRSRGDGGARRYELIPPSERRRIHLAAVCSAGLRVGAEFVAVLPVDAVEVVVVCELDGASGAAPVLQMLVTAKSLTEQPWTSSEAINLAKALRARLSWTINGGFSPIELVDPPPLPQSAR